MRITFDSRKRIKTIEERGLDFLDAATVFEGEVNVLLLLVMFNAVEVGIYFR